MNESAVRKILARKPDDVELAAWVAGQLSLVAEVRAAVREVRGQAERDRAWLERRDYERDQRLGAVRGQCPHYGRRHHPDPAGGADSFDRCDDCGQEW